MAKNNLKLAPKEHEHYCIGCGKTKTSRYFYVSNSPKYDNDTNFNRPPWCKECVKNKVYNNNTGLPDRQKFIDCLKDIFDVPFYQKIYVEVLDSGKELVGEYLKRLNLTNKNKRLTFSDGETGEDNDNALRKIDIENNDKFYSVEWMGYYTKAELEYLDSYYSNLHNDFKIITTNHKDYARKIAQASLAVNKAYQDMINGVSGSDKRYKDLQETFDKLSKSAQFSENSRSANDVGISGIGQVVDKIESKQWIYEVEEFPKDALDHLLDQFSNIGKSL